MRVSGVGGGGNSWCRCIERPWVWGGELKSRQGVTEKDSRTGTHGVRDGGEVVAALPVRRRVGEQESVRRWRGESGGGEGREEGRKESPNIIPV